MTMVTTMEGAILKVPSLRFMNPNAKFMNPESFPLRRRYEFRFRTVSSASAAETATPYSSSPPFSFSKLGAGSLGHISRPDFPILHQVYFFRLVLHMQSRK